ncbi:hypothetical protein TSAR_012868 [Trichomalopsis sarcophagae]|uniref:Uncharacterized protein n=1 Tax=Trichomalopsis sarcophagae TaxID=543379 RepID=A0A232ENQ4_9HYME|nr:hypothetical protein TSAR_012868 [Trichomalopsis sarcophagae]
MSEAPSHDFLDEDSFFSEMMSSQSDLEDQILLLKISFLKKPLNHSMHEVLNNDRCIEEKLEELQNFFSSNSIRNAPIDILDEKIFNTALIGAQKIYFEVINTINELLRSNQNKTTDVKNQLNVLVNLLKCWDLCISHIKALEKVSIIDIKSFPASLFDVMADMLRHCKNSTAYYGDYFNSVSEILTTLFRQCVNTLNVFYSLVDSIISFDTNQEVEMNLLLKIIDETGKIATLTSGMDAKTLTDMWKRFGKLSSNYNIEMKNISPSTVTQHFRGLSESIVTVLSAINQKSQRSSNERSVLCCRLLFKILEKLCDTYCGWIRNDVMVAIILMLANLFRYTEHCLKLDGYHPEFIRFIVSNFVFMIEPFLDVIFKNDTFKSGFFDYNKSIEDDALGYHLLLLKIVKKISALPYEVQRDWCNKEFNILDACFKNIDRLTREICVGKQEIQLSRDAGQGFYVANIYEATCLSIFSLVCHIPDADFSELVILLIKHLLSGGFFSSLLSSDVWCFLCRLGSSEMCFNHFKHLMQIYELLEERKHNVNVVMLSTLLSRQYAFLSEKDKIEVINSIEKSSDPHKWSCLARIVDPQKMQLLRQQIDASTANSEIASNLKTLEEQPTLHNLGSLVKNLSIIEACDVPQDKQSIDTFVNMWNKLVYILGDCEGTLRLLLEDLAVALIRATHPQEVESKYITSILESTTSLYPYASSALRLELCRLLYRWSAYLTEVDSSVVAELYCRLLSDVKPCVQQEAFESFEHLTRACPNAGLISSVALSIKNAQSEVSRTLPAYISGEVVHSLAGFRSHDEFFAVLSGTTLGPKKHECYKRSQADREEKVLKLDEEASGNLIKNDSGFEDVEKRAEKICSEMELLLKHKSQIRRDTLEKLRQVWHMFIESGD